MTTAPTVTAVGSVYTLVIPAGTNTSPFVKYETVSSYSLGGHFVSSYIGPADFLFSSSDVASALATPTTSSPTAEGTSSQPGSSATSSPIVTITGDDNVQTTLSSPVPEATPTPTSSSSIDVLSASAIAGITIAAVSVLTFVILLMIYLLRRRKRDQALPDPAPTAPPYEKAELPANEMTLYSMFKEKLKLERRGTVKEMPADEPRERVELEGSEVEAKPTTLAEGSQ